MHCSIITTNGGPVSQRSKSQHWSSPGTGKSTHTEKAKQTCKDRQGGWALLSSDPILKIQIALQAKNECSIFPEVITQRPSLWSFRLWAQRHCRIALALFRWCAKTAFNYSLSRVLLAAVAIWAAIVCRRSPGAGRIRRGAKNGILFIDCQGWKRAKNSSFQTFWIPQKTIIKQIKWPV